jgi:hypothetical protein
MLPTFEVGKTYTLTIENTPEGDLEECPTGFTGVCTEAVDDYVVLECEIAGGVEVVDFTYCWKHDQWHDDNLWGNLVGAVESEKGCPGADNQKWK